MAFAVQSNSDYRTGCSNCVVACPVDALELHWGVPESASNICTARDNEPKVPGFINRLTAGCGECVQTCPHDSIRLTGPWETRAEAKVQ
ncbi:4Fe-4S dicluster domain-containing protein [Methanoregula sp.]|uniref:4Fe-4S dicluster domain-containing protein n=1 Tax=Methanoregula sp. TaxID=2052170 RepID=UPI002CAB87BC|nr:4Fe-4S dicluster domain-containing protein [Methanoregula sp.]HVP97495.1 4Fe-4S dicluster domain-containing protein [Methanoregula sp.]